MDGPRVRASRLGSARADHWAGGPARRPTCPGALLPLARTNARPHVARPSTPAVNYMLFTGITSMIICIVFIVLYIIKADENPTVRLIELVINILWWIFWFAAAITISTALNDIQSAFNYSAYQASCAFAWLTWLLWSVSTVLSFLGTRSKAGPSGGATPSAPQTNMV